MKLEVTVSEIADIFKEIQERPGQLFEMIRLDIREVVGKYLTTMMNGGCQIICVNEISCCSSGHPISIENGKLIDRFAPISGGHCPFFLNIFQR
jgi:hypothetical protein